MFGFVEVRVVDPQLATVADGGARVGSFDLATKKIGCGKSDRAASDERFLQETTCFLLGEIRGEGRKPGAVLLHLLDQRSRLSRIQGGREGCRGCKDHGEGRYSERAHAKLRLESARWGHS